MTSLTFHYYAIIFYRKFFYLHCFELQQTYEKTTESFLGKKNIVKNVMTVFFLRVRIIILLSQIPH